jgi:hypothetical protein
MLWQFLPLMEITISKLGTMAETMATIGEQALLLWDLDHWRSRRLTLESTRTQTVTSKGTYNSLE